MTDLYVEASLSGCVYPARFEGFVDLAWELAGPRGSFRTAREVVGEDPRYPYGSTYYWFKDRQEVEALAKKFYHLSPPAGDLGLKEENERSKILLVYSPHGLDGEKIALPRLTKSAGNFSWVEWERYEQLGTSTLHVGAVTFPAPSSRSLEDEVEPYMQNLLALFGRLVGKCRPALAWCGEMVEEAGTEFNVVRKQAFPVVNWVNFFGPLYTKKYGKDSFLRAPGHHSEAPSDSSVLYQATSGFMPRLAAEPPPNRVTGYFVEQLGIPVVAYRPWLQNELASRKTDERKRRSRR